MDGVGVLTKGSAYGEYLTLSPTLVHWAPTQQILVAGSLVQVYLWEETVIYILLLQITYVWDSDTNQIISSNPITLGSTLSVGKQLH